MRYRRPPASTPPVPVALGISIAVLGLAVGFLGFGRIVTRVDTYLGVAPSVTTAGITERLTTGSWVVFTMCETHATNAPYACPQLNPGDIVIGARPADSSSKRLPIRARITSVPVNSPLPGS